MAKAVFFDAGFTILEPAIPVADVYVAKARLLGIDVPEEDFKALLMQSWERLARTYETDNDLASSDELERESWRRYTRFLAEPFSELLAVHGEWLQLLFSHFDDPEAWRPISGAEAVFRALQDRGITVGIVSNWHTSLHRILAGHRLDQFCSFILTSAEAGHKKPHPLIFEEALRRGGVPASHTVHVGDSWQADVEGARAMGIRPVLFDRYASAPACDPDVAVIECLSALIERL